MRRARPAVKGTPAAPSAARTADGIIARSEGAMRAAIAAIPDGRYTHRIEVETVDDRVTLAELIAAAGGGIIPFDLGLLWEIIAAEVKPLAGLSHAKLSAEGHLLDAAAWAGLPFCEGETLHFKPAALPAAANA